MKPFQAYVLICTKQAKIRDVSSFLLDCPLVENVHELYGQYDIIAKLKGDSHVHVNEFVMNELVPHEDIDRTETLIVADLPS